jgi:hypothetical protein
MWKKTTALTTFVILLWAGALAWNYFLRATYTFAYTAAIFAIGYVSFVGFLNISRALRGSPGAFQDGDVRLALTCAFVAVFFALLSFYAFTLDEPTPFAQQIIDSFLTITVIVVGFYFATTGAIELFKIRERGRARTPEETGKGS